MPLKETPEKFLYYVTLNFDGSLRVVRSQKKSFSDFNEIWYVHCR